MPDATPATPTPAPPPPMSPMERAMAALDPKPEAAPAPPPAPEPKVEATPEPTKATDKPDDKAESKTKEPTVAERFAFMAKKEKAIVERDRAIKEREAKLAEREAAVKAFEEKWTRDPVGAIADRGVSYEDLTKSVLSSTDPAARQAAQMREVALTAQRALAEAAAAKEALEKAKADAERAEAEKARTGFQSEVASFVKANADKFELTAKLGQEPLVYAVIEAEYQKTGEMLSTEAAAEKVEKYLEEQAEKVITAKKYAARFAPPAPKPQAPTLTNATTPAPPVSRSRMTEQERMAAAIAALKD